MNDHYDVMTLKIDPSENMGTEYPYISLWEHRTYSRVTSNWMWKGFIPVWQRRYSRIKIQSQWVIIIHTLNSVREDQTFDSQQTVCTEVFILSQCTMSDLFASFDRQLAHHFLYILSLSFNDAEQGVSPRLSPWHISIYKCLKHDLAGHWAVTKGLSRQIFPRFFPWVWGLLKAMVTLSLCHNSLRTRQWGA